MGVDWSDTLRGPARSSALCVDFPNVRDGEGAVGNAYRLTGLPTTFVVDGDGRIRAVLRGPRRAEPHSRLRSPR